FRSVTVPASATLTATRWNGQLGGIVAFRAVGTVSIAGAVSADGLGFRGGTAPDPAHGQAGESFGGTAPLLASSHRNPGGGGIGPSDSSGGLAAANHEDGGGCAGNAGCGTTFSVCSAETRNVGSAIKPDNGGCADSSCTDTFAVCNVKPQGGAYATDHPSAAL